MSVMVIRHALSEANNFDNIGTLAFASMNAPLMELGRRQAFDLGNQLRSEYVLEPAYTNVATSELKRTQETARAAGFITLRKYPALNEVAHGVVLPDLRDMLDQNILPAEAIKSAEVILSQPPQEEIWITHGLVIAGLCKVLGVHQDKRLIPRFCEIRELTI